MTGRKGFSLIEVLAAVAILSGVLFAVTRILSASYIYVSKIHNIYLGTELARLKLHDVEEIIKKDGLPEMETEEEGEFEENEYEDFKWKYSIKKVFIPLPDISSSAADGTEGQAEEAAGMLSLAKGNIEDFFKERIRKLTLKVYWGEGEKESEKVVFTVFLTTPGTVKTFQQFQGAGNPSKTRTPDGGGDRKSDPGYNRFRTPGNGGDMRNPGIVPKTNPEMTP